jgi:hypothetical protein
MRTIASCVIGLVQQSALRVRLQILAYDGRLVGVDAVPRNEGLAVDAYKDQATPLACFVSSERLPAN